MEKINMDNELYSYIFDKMKKSIQLSDIKEIMNYKKILVLGTNYNKSMLQFMDNLSDSKVRQCSIVAQTATQRMLNEYKGNNADVISWNKGYGKELTEYLLKNVDFTNIDAFVYFSSQIDDLRNCNIFEMILEIIKVKKVDVYCIEFSGYVYMHKNIDIYYKAMKLYQDINDFIEL